MPLFYYVIGTTVLDVLDGPKLLLSHLLNYMKAHVPWLWSGKTEVSTSFLSFIDLCFSCSCYYSSFCRDSEA